MPLVTWPALLEEPDESPPFLIEPYLPLGGIILLHGKWSAGKSPLTWELARCVATGSSFFGCPTRAGRVLYLETDTPKLLVKKRLRQLAAPPPEDVTWLFGGGACNIFMPRDTTRLELQTAATSVKPALVIINTLRKVHTLDITANETPVRLYGEFQHLFPGASLIFVHHDKKTPTDPKARQRAGEEFLGSQAWINDAQTGLHLVRHGYQPRYDGELLELQHTKSQVSELADPLKLILHRDGANLSPMSEDRDAVILRAWEATDPRLAKGQRVKQVTEVTKWSERTIHTVLKAHGI